MQHNRTKQFDLILAILSLVFVFHPLSSLALDANSEKPVPYWGLASGVWKEGAGEYVINSEPEATIVMRNVAPTTLPDLMFNKECLLDITDEISPCFYLFGSSGAKLFNSRSYANDYLKSAVAVLGYGAVNVVGDSYSDQELSDFAYWGKHLRQSVDSSDSNAFYQQTNYKFNPDAQSYWNSTAGTNKNTKMNETVSRLLLGAKNASETNGILTDARSGRYKWIARPTTYGICGKFSTCSDANQYPEGVVWSTRDSCVGLSCTSVSINNKTSDPLGGPVKYKDKATLIVKSGNLAVNDSFIADTSDSSASFGFIVENGNAVITNLSKNKTLTIRASLFVPNGSIIINGGNVDLIGSFVAKDFAINSNFASNINFIYDSRGENAFPPGFRDLQVLSREND